MKVFMIWSSGLILTWLFGYITGFYIERGKNHAEAALIKAETDAKVKELEIFVTIQEEKFQQQIASLTYSLQEKEEEHAEAISHLHSDYAGRMSALNQRISRYQSLSNGSRESRVCLAEHAGRLDESIEQGRLLAQELRQFAQSWRDRLDLCESNWNTLIEQLNQRPDQ